MIVTKVAASRGEKTILHERWFTFFPDLLPSKDSAGGLFESLGEGRVPPNSGPQRTRKSGEVVSYVREGSLVYEDSTKLIEVMRAGEFHRTTLGAGFHYQETNASPTHWAHVFQIWFTPTGDFEPGHERKRFGTAERRHGLCLVASPDGRDGSLTVHQDGFLYSAIMPKGRHLVHALSINRSACLHVVEGEIQLADLTLHTGDIALLSDERAVSFSSTQHSEILLLDLRDPPQALNGANSHKEVSKPSFAPPSQ
jgi:quercetin 2,3-dioxygenase